MSYGLWCELCLLCSCSGHFVDNEVIGFICEPEVWLVLSAHSSVDDIVSACLSSCLPSVLKYDDAKSQLNHSGTDSPWSKGMRLYTFLFNCDDAGITSNCPWVAVTWNDVCVWGTVSLSGPLMTSYLNTKNVKVNPFVPICELFCAKCDWTSVK